VEQQIKIVRNQLTTSRPKDGKARTVPLPEAVAVELAEHLRHHGEHADQFVFTSREHKPLNRNYFNSRLWRPALLTAGVEPCRANGMHALRHFYASVLIDAGESVKAVAEYLGHADPGFTLRVYAHLFPSSEDRARSAVDRVLRGAGLPAVTGPA
jgi:integrase